MTSVSYPPLDLSSAQTWTGAHQWSKNGAISLPTIYGSGTWITGGTATTTKPYALIEASGATSNNWNTSGTGLGINAASGFAGNIFDAQVNGTSRLKLDAGNSVLTLSTGWGFVSASGFDLNNQATGQLLVTSGGKFAWSQNTSVTNGNRDTAVERDAAGVVAATNGTAATYRDFLARAFRHTPLTITTLPTGVAGMVAYVTDGDAGLAWGATVVNSGGSSTKYLVWYNGSNWTVAGK